MPGEQSFTVEAVLGKKMMDGKAHYHIKWKGYASADNTWEPFGNIAQFRELVTAYEVTASGGKDTASRKLNTSNSLDAWNYDDLLPRPALSVSGWGSRRFYCRLYYNGNLKVNPLPPQRRGEVEERLFPGVENEPGYTRLHFNPPIGHFNNTPS